MSEIEGVLAERVIERESSLHSTVSDTHLRKSLSNKNSHLTSIKGGYRDGKL